MPALLPNDAVAIGIGAFLGAMSRFQAGKLAGEWIAADPVKRAPYNGWHTAAINVGGSFVLGGVTAFPLINNPVEAIKSIPPKVGAPPAFGLTPRQKLMMGVGFCGSFTTFSTYSVDIVTWLAKGETKKAAAYVLTNNVGGMLAAAAGLVLVKKLFGA